MDSIFSSPSLHSPQPPPFRFKSPHFPPFTSIRPFPNRTRRFFPNKPRNLISLASIKTPPITKQQGEEDAKQNDAVLALPFTTANAIVSCKKEEPSVTNCLLKLLLRAVFCFAVGFSAVGAFRVPAIAIAATAATVKNDVVLGKKDKKEKETSKSSKSHEYADCTDRLLEEVSGLLKIIEEVRNGNGDVDNVEVTLEAVKSKKEELRKEIMDRLQKELRVLRRDKAGLGKRAGEIIDEIIKAKKEYDKLKRKKEVDDNQKVRMGVLETRVEGLENEYNGIWERVSEIEDLILRKETVALSYGVREINFIERECEQLVQRFKHEMRQKDIKRSHNLIT